MRSLRECCGVGVGCPVLNLQERLWALEMHFTNGTLAAEDSPSFSLLQSMPIPHLPGGALGLQVLQTQITQVRTRQEHLLRKVDNFTRNPGLAPSPCTGTLQRMESRGCWFMGKGISGPETPSPAKRACQNTEYETLGPKTRGESQMDRHEVTAPSGAADRWVKNLGCKCPIQAEYDLQEPGTRATGPRPGLSHKAHRWI